MASATTALEAGVTLARRVIAAWEGGDLAGAGPSGRAKRFRTERAAALAGVKLLRQKGPSA